MIEKITIDDGIYEDIPDQVYRSWDRMSKSTLDYGMESMADLKAAVDGLLFKETKSLAFGRAFHDRLLLPKLFRDNYATAEQCSGVKKDGDRCSRLGSSRFDSLWYCTQHKPNVDPDAIAHLTPNEYDTIESMGQSVYAHRAVKLLRQNGGCEVSMAWTDPSTGIKMKARMDKVTRMDGVPVIVDLKSCQTLNTYKLEKHLYDYGYHRQDAIYREGYKIITGEVADFLLVFVRKTLPWPVAVRRLCPASRDLGVFEYHNLLGRWSRCLESGIYDAYGDDIDEISVPQYQLKVLETVNLDSLAG